MKKRILAILPISIGGRLTTSSIIDGYRQNGCDVTVFDELFGNNFDEVLKNSYDQILGYDFSGLKIKIDNNLKIPSVNYFSDDIRTSASGPEWEKYLPYLENEDNYTFYWDKVLTSYENFNNIHIGQALLTLDKNVPNRYPMQALRMAQEVGYEKEFSLPLSILISEANAENMGMIEKMLGEQEFLSENEDFVSERLISLLRNAGTGLSFIYEHNDEVTLDDVKRFIDKHQREE